MKNKELWKDIKGYKGFYQVSNRGNIRSFIIKKTQLKAKEPSYLKPYINNSGYPSIDLSANYCTLIEGRRKVYKVHRLVALAFIPNTQNKPDVNHKDGNKLNNLLDNLEWVTKSENSKHMWANNLIKPTKLKNEVIGVNYLIRIGYNAKEVNNILEFSRDNIHGTYNTTSYKLVIYKEKQCIIMCNIYNLYDFRFLIKILGIKFRNEYNYKNGKLK
jgi:archaellin